MELLNKKLIEKIVNIILNILLFIFGFILLVSIYTGIQTKLLNKDYSDFFGYSIFEVQTGSMAKTINAGDWIIIKLTRDINLDDIITYRLNNDYITHRVIEVYNKNYITKGDANNSKDDPINQSQIIGKVVKILPNFGFLRKTVFSPSVLIALIVTLFLFSLAFKKNKNETSEKSIFLNIIDKVKKVFGKLKTKKGDFVLEKKEEEKSEVEIKSLNESAAEDLKKDLDVTSNFKITSAYEDNNEKEYQSEEELENELEKTAYFRVINVDASEIDKTLLEIAENKITADSKNKLKKEETKEIKEENEKTEDDSLTNINLDFLKTGKGIKGKNIIDTSMLIKKEEIEDLFEILSRGNISKIREDFADNYIKAKYYNACSDFEASNKPSLSKIKKYIKDYGNKLITKYEGKNKNYEDIVNKYIKTYELISSLDQANDSIEDLRVKKEFYKSEILEIHEDLRFDEIEKIVNNVLETQKIGKNNLEYFLKNLETNTFVLNFNKLVNKNFYALALEHNISFSKVYSDYIIDKTYTEGIVAEDKIFVILSLLSAELIKNMINYNNKKYILYIPSSLYNKDKKLDRILKMIDDDYVRSSIYILTTHENLLLNKKRIKSFINKGYKFALVFDKEIDKLKDKGNLYIMDYIFIDKKNNYKDEIISNIPSELSKNVIIEDIMDKVGGE